MKVNDLEGKEVGIFFFGGVTMVTTIVLLSFLVGHWVTTRSNVPTVVSVQSAQPSVAVNVPQTPAPVVNVQPSTATVNVHVPEGPAPTVHVSTPQPLVTFVNRDDRPASVIKEPTQPVKEEKKAAPAVPLPVSVEKNSGMNEDKADKARRELDQALAAPSFDAVYKYAEFYLARYCEKHSLDASAEARNWNKSWQQRVADSQNSGSGGVSEQQLLNDVCIQKRDNFNVKTATPEQIVEGCRLLLRYRDAELQPPSQMVKAATPEYLRDTITVLAVGIK